MHEMSETENENGCVSLTLVNIFCLQVQDHICSSTWETLLHFNWETDYCKSQGVGLFGEGHVGPLRTLAFW